MRIKFYQFSGEYRALIKAFSKKEALQLFKEGVCDVVKAKDAVEVSLLQAWDEWYQALTPEDSLLEHIENFVDNKASVLTTDPLIA
ncbi:hypothetical protein [Listeria booriae]|uniref:Uncharacterized protein n=1 Tax=Listeria booriae TaxID=1552123 RepID=A0A7X0WGM6_9LIST|nr:hypothetical protein [Listeria booriae]MBC1228816.1 hypothetical protein [Listeria booriae]MBC1318447.1 hypothetical protein [Listeria booriae]MBC1333465.1 hypothetical protein [Listeria booriae]MBC2373631.1 hypothetical protein [Listeria booriae]MBC2388770.1 hypothetical protein [Listeria booriae]